MRGILLLQCQEVELPMVLLPPGAIEPAVLPTGFPRESAHLLPAHSSVYNHMGVAGMERGRASFQIRMNGECGVEYNGLKPNSWLTLLESERVYIL